MAKIPYFPFFPDDWLSSSRIDLLTAEQERGYLRLLCRSWNMPDCVLPNNEPLLLKWSRMPSAEDLRTLCERFADGMEPLFVRVGKGWRNPKLYSLWLKAQDKHEKAVENASARYKKKSEPADAVQTQSDGTANQNQNQNQNQIKEKSKDRVRKQREPFTPPTVEQVREYCQQRGNKIDPEYFVASNNAKGWVIGKNKTPAKDWKAMIITWEKTQAGGSVDGKDGSFPRKSFKQQEDERHEAAKREVERRLGIGPRRAGVPGDIHAPEDNGFGPAGELDKEIIEGSAMEVTED